MIFTFFFKKNFNTFSFQEKKVNSQKLFNSILILIIYE